MALVAVRWTQCIPSDIVSVAQLALQQSKGQTLHSTVEQTNLPEEARGKVGQSSSSA